MKKPFLITLIISFLSCTMNATPYEDLLVAVQHGNWEEILTTWKECTGTEDLNARIEGKNLVQLAQENGREDIVDIVEILLCVNEEEAHLTESSNLRPTDYISIPDGSQDPHVQQDLKGHLLMLAMKEQLSRVLGTHEKPTTAEFLRERRISL